MILRFACPFRNADVFHHICYFLWNLGRAMADDSGDEAEAPDGGEDDALELRRVGEIPSFPDGVLDHVTIAEGLGGLDLERAARTSGSRFAYLMGPLVRLQMSLVLIQHGSDVFERALMTQWHLNYLSAVTIFVKVQP